MDILQSGTGELIQPFDLDEFREWNRTQKSRKLVDKRMSEQEAVSKFVYDGCYIGTELYGTVRAPMSLAREVVRQGKKDLRVCGQGVLELDLWLAAGLVKKLDITYIGLEVYGTSSALRRAVESGQVEKCVEWSNGAITWRMKATAMGVPFLPTRSMLGTDTLGIQRRQGGRGPVHRHQSRPAARAGAGCGSHPRASRGQIRQLSDRGHQRLRGGNVTGLQTPDRQR